MTSLGFAATREELALDLAEAGFSTAENLVATMDPPLVVIACDEPYLAEDQTFSRAEMIMNLALYVVYDLDPGEAPSTAADRAIQAVVLGIDDRWDLTDVSAPFKASNLGGRPCCRVRISTTVRLTSPPEGSP